MIGADGVVVGTTTSGTDGTFVFDGVPLRTHTLVESTRLGFTDVTDSDGGDPNSITVPVAPGVDTVCLEFIDEEPSSGPSASPTAVLLPAATTGAPTAERTPSPTAKPTPEPTPAPVPVVGSIAGASVSGIILEDTDEVGDGDEPIVDVAVTLIVADGFVVGTSTTGTDGTFVFDGVPRRTYTVVESTCPGFTDVTDSDGGDPKRRSKLDHCYCGTRC